MRRVVAGDPHAGALEARHRVGGGQFDQVGIAGEKGVRPRQILGNAGERQLGEPRHPLGVPVGLVRHEVQAHPRHQGGEPVGAGAGGLEGELRPVPPDRLVLRRRRDQEPQHLVGKQRVDRLGGDLHRHGVELLVGRHRRQARAHLRGLALVVVGRLGVEHLVEVPDHRVGVEGRAVVELDPLAQAEDPVAAIRGVALPRGGEPRHQLARPVGDVELPGDQGIVEGESGELVAPRAAVRLAGGERQVEQRDAVGQAARRRPRRAGRGGPLRERGTGGAEGREGRGSGEQLAAREGGVTHRWTPAGARPVRPRYAPDVCKEHARS